MPTKRIPYQLQVFTLRMWQETIEGDQWEWRGEVKNTTTGERRYFRDWHVLIDLLPQLLNTPSDEPMEGQEQEQRSIWAE